MKRTLKRLGSRFVVALIAAIGLFIFAFILLEMIPSMVPTFAWRTRWPYLQEPAIRHLVERLHVGMTYEEVVDIMGSPDNPNSTPDHYGRIVYSYNVNFGFNRGIDVYMKDGRVVEIFEYD